MTCGFTGNIAFLCKDTRFVFYNFFGIECMFQWATIWLRMWLYFFHIRLSALPYKIQEKNCKTLLFTMNSSWLCYLFLKTLVPYNQTRFLPGCRTTDGHWSQWQPVVEWKIGLSIIKLLSCVGSRRPLLHYQQASLIKLAERPSSGWPQLHCFWIVPQVPSNVTLSLTLFLQFLFVLVLILLYLKSSQSYVSLCLCLTAPLIHFDGVLCQLRCSGVEWLSSGRLAVQSPALSLNVKVSLGKRLNLKTLPMLCHWRVS